jgi:hypothetical protein
LVGHAKSTIVWYISTFVRYISRWLVTTDLLAFEFQSLHGVSEVTISVVTLFFLASEVHTKLFRHILWKNVRRVDEGIMEVKHTQILFLFGSSIDLYSATRLLLPLMDGRIVFICIGCCRVALASVTLFESGSGVGTGMRCTIHNGILLILPWSSDLGIIPRVNGIGSNGTRHDRNSGHGSLMQVHLGNKRLQDC